MKKQSLQSYLAKKTHTHVAVMKVIGIVNILVGYDNVHTQEKDWFYVPILFSWKFVALCVYFLIYPHILSIFPHIYILNKD